MGHPAIIKHAKVEKASIFWGDETEVSNQDQIRRSRAPKDKTPIIARTTKRIPNSMISTVSNRGQMWFIFYDAERGRAFSINADRFIAFLRRLIKDAEKKVFLIVDNLKVHHAEKVTAWIASHTHEAELFYLPPYAPDHNPGEFLNGDLKQKLRQKPQSGIKEDIVKTKRAVMRNIQRSPERIRTYFQAESIKYAA